MIELSFSELIRDNALLKSSLSGYPKLDLKILSNITVNQLVPLLEYTLRKDGLNAYVETGEYDNIIQESAVINTNTIPVIIWELCNLKEGFVYELENEDDSYFDKFLHKVQEEILIVFNNLYSSGLVIFNTFSHFVFSILSLSISKTDIKIITWRVPSKLIWLANSIFAAMVCYPLEVVNKRRIFVDSRVGAVKFGIDVWRS
jgi:hypothetical protein